MPLTHTIIAPGAAHTIGLSCLGDALIGLYSDLAVTTAGAGLVCLTPIQVPCPTTFDRIGCNINTAGGGGTTFRLGIYNSSSEIPDGQSVALDAGTLDATLTGVRELAINKQLSPGLYFLCIETQDGTIKPVFHSFGSTANASVPKFWGCYYTRGGGYGALTDPCPATTADASAAPVIWLHISS